MSVPRYRIQVLLIDSWLLVLVVAGEPEKTSADRVAVVGADVLVHFDNELDFSESSLKELLGPKMGELIDPCGC
ncbi:hypothetical protein HOY82DRAFT_613988 [Tuber indicum]|nr:hypothetical protein HOY82DRAFT_613988 [Tuber indicum]